MSTDWKDTTYNSILVVVDRLTKMVHSKPAQMIDAPGLAEIISDVVIRYHDLPDSATETQSSLPSSGPPGTTSKFNCGYRQRVSSKKILAPVQDSTRNLMTACRKNLPHGLDIANPFPPDLSGYVHGFSY